MSTVLKPSPVETSSSPAERPYRFTSDDFYRMVDLEIFPDEVRVGLWEGQVYEEMAKKHPHSYSCAGLIAALFPVLPPGWSLWPGCSIRLSQDKSPLPDLMILRGVREHYKTRRPVAADAALVVELSESSLRIDTGTKLKAYATAGIPVYWVVNLKDNVIQVYADPVPPEARYASATTIGPDDSIPLILDGTQVALITASEIL